MSDANQVPYAWLATRIFRHRLRRQDTGRDAALYAGFCVVGKFAQLAGVARYGWSLAAGPRQKTPREATDQGREPSDQTPG